MVRETTAECLRLHQYNAARVNLIHNQQLMKTHILSLTVLIYAALTGYAQTADQALLFSRTSPLGTARSQALGGAMGAVGADFSSTFINPAGLGLYKRNEANASIAINADLTQTKYLGLTSEDGRTSMHVPSFGVVISKVYSELGDDRKKGLVALNFATGMSRVANFQQNFYYSGVNQKNSILDHFTNNANGTPYQALSSANPLNDNNPTAQAYRTYLIDTLSGKTDQFQSPLTGLNAYSLKQTNQTSGRGAVYEYNISASANLSNFLYFGAGLILTNVNYQSSYSFEETVLENTVPNYKGMRQSGTTIASGTGVSGRFGLLIRPSQYFRLGLSAQTPSRINMRNDYKYTTRSEINHFVTEYSPPANDYNEYQIITPAHYTGSAAVIFPGYGLISVDVEMIDYASAQLKSNHFNTDQQNAIIGNLYQQTYNIRLGGEYTFDDPTGSLADAYRLRAGYAMYGSPYKSSTTSIKENNLIRQSLSAGLGMLFDRLFFDFTVVGLYGKDYYQPYTQVAEIPMAENTFRNFNFVLSGGIRF